MQKYDEKALYETLIQNTGDYIREVQNKIKEYLSSIDDNIAKAFTPTALSYSDFDLDGVNSDIDSVYIIIYTYNTDSPTKKDFDYYEYYRHITKIANSFRKVFKQIENPYGFKLKEYYKNRIGLYVDIKKIIKMNGNMPKKNRGRH